jgi:hypothetical protein
MISNIGRNDPCPCGSGRKYKKCCLERQQDESRQEAAARRARERRNEAVGHALGWLGRHHRDALLAALEEFESAAAIDDGRPLSEGDQDYLRMQALEWALAEGTTEIDGREVRLRDLVLEGGLVLEADQRKWLERATEEPLRLWKIVGVRPGEGLELQDLLDEGAATVWTTERSGSRTLRRTEVIAARLARWNGGWEVGVLYSIPDHGVLRLVSHIEDAAGAGGADPHRARRIGRLIRDYWVRLFTRRQPIPDIIDSGGDPIELTTDRWQVIDEDELKRRLAAEPDVVGTREKGWSRLQDPGAETSRTLLALNPGKRPDRLEVFARTRKLADEGRTWLERVAGRSLRFLTREIVDPMSERVISGARPSGGRSLAVEAFRIGDRTPPGPDGEIPPDLKSRLMEKIYRQQYAGMADRTIPDLGGKTPRQLLRARGGERRVRLWLEGFERTERRMAEDDGREPVDLGFLWEEIGLAR